MKVLIPFTLDVKKTNVQKIIHANQGEGLDRKLIITLVSGSEPLILDSENQSVQFVANKPDGTTIYNSTAIKDGKVIIYLTSQTTAAVGDVDCQLEVVSTDEGSVGSGVIYSAKFVIDVEKSLVDAEEIESSNEFSELLQLIQTAGKGKIYTGTTTPGTDPTNYPLVKQDDVYLKIENDTVTIYEAASVSTTVTWSEKYKVYTKTKIDLLLKNKQNVISDTAVGSSILLNRSSDNSIKSLKICGKSTQDGTPTVDNPISIDNADADITINDTLHEIDIATLKGVQVLSGGNYTDENNKQWICDTIEKYADGSGKLIQRVGSITFNGSETWTKDANTTRLFYRNTALPNSNTSSPTTLFSHFSLKNNATAVNNNDNTYVIGNGVLWTSPTLNGARLTVAEWKEYLQSNNATLYYSLAQSVETLLTAEQLAELDLNTYYPNTTIISECGLVVEYVCDIESLLDEKQNELVVGSGLKKKENVITIMPEYKPGFIIEDEVTYDEVASGLINHNTGGYSSDSNIHKKKAVTFNDVYAIRAATYNYNAAYSAITFLDENENVIGYYPEDATEASLELIKDYILTIDDPNIAYIVVNGTPDTYECVIREAQTINFEEALERKCLYLSDAPAFKSDTELANIESGWLSATSAKYDGTDNPNCKHAKISVDYGDIYYISGKTFNYGNKYRVINVLDSNGDLLETYPASSIEEATKEYIDYKYVVKNKYAAYIVVNGNPGGISIKKGIKVSVEKYVEENGTKSEYLTDFINMADMGKRIRLGGKSFAWDSLDGGYMTIVFDDGKTDLSSVSDIFEEYNIPLCAAIIPRNLSTASADTRTIQEVCEDIVENGGEILAHEGPVLTSPTDYDTIKTILMKSKERLVGAGFNIRGVIMPGGTGAITWKGNNLQRFTQMFYDYSDLCGDDPQYYKPRKGMGNATVSDTKGYIDDAVANNKWYVFFAHDLTELTEANLREIIEYGLAQGINVKTYSYMYDTFGIFE